MMRQKKLVSLGFRTPRFTVDGASVRQPAHRGNLAQLPPEFDPRLAAGVAAIKIAVSAGGKNDVRIRGIRAKSPDRGIRLHRQRQQLPALPKVVGSRNGTRVSRRK